MEAWSFHRDGLKTSVSSRYFDSQARSVDVLVTVNMLLYDSSRHLVSGRMEVLLAGSAPVALCLTPNAEASLTHADNSNLPDRCSSWEDKVSSTHWDRAGSPRLCCSAALVGAV